MSEIAFIKCIGYNTIYGSLQGNDVTPKQVPKHYSLHLFTCYLFLQQLVNVALYSSVIYITCYTNKNKSQSKSMVQIKHTLTVGQFTNKRICGYLSLNQTTID